MTKGKTDHDRYVEAKIGGWACLVFLIMLAYATATSVNADQIVHKFKSPSFSGIGTSSHYLTIENQEFNRKEAIREEIKAYQEDLERAKTRI